jgi:20S proteasome alpha/beta subunit
VVLASDSQATHGELRQSQPKLFTTCHGIAWGSAGPFACTQDLYTALEAAELDDNPDRERAKVAIKGAMRAASANLGRSGDSSQFEGLFGWYAAEESRHYLLWARQDGHLEFERPFGAIGSGAGLGRFGFVRAQFLEYDALPLSVTQLITHMVAEDAVRASAKGVDLPIQLAFACRGETQVMQPENVKGISDAVDAFRESQRDFLVGSPATGGTAGRFEIKLRGT